MKTPEQRARTNATARLWAKKHRKANVERTRAWRKANPHKQIEYRATHRKWAQDNPDAVKAHRLKTQYGITLEQFNHIAELQHHACAICEQVRPLVVDHNHTTNEVRQLLCSQCNTALGMFQDCPEILRRATLYLKVHNVRL